MSIEIIDIEQPKTGGDPILIKGTENNGEMNSLMESRVEESPEEEEEVKQNDQQTHRELLEALNVARKDTSEEDKEDFVIIPLSKGVKRYSS